MTKVRHLFRALPALLVLLVLGIVWQAHSSNTPVGAAPAIQATEVGATVGTAQAAGTATTTVPAGPVPTSAPSIMDTPSPRPSPIITPSSADVADEEEHAAPTEEPDETADRTGAVVSGIALLVAAIGLGIFLRRN
ncbi:MAG: hypothetical protein M3506_02405 [Chloroflexota bacterium]|nr:hypothetical protein [Chloroflexota bacterium]